MCFFDEGSSICTPANLQFFPDRSLESSEESVQEWRGMCKNPWKLSFIYYRINMTNIIKNTSFAIWHMCWLCLQWMPLWWGLRVPIQLCETDLVNMTWQASRQAFSNLLPGSFSHQHWTMLWPLPTAFPALSEGLCQFPEWIFGVKFYFRT